MGTATEQTQRDILAELETHTLPDDAATETTLAACLTELEDVPKHANLDIHPTTKHLGVAVEESVLPSGAATQTTLALCLTALQSIQNLVGALHDVGLDELDVNVVSSALPTGAATQTTLAAIETALGNLLTELQLKADLTETQPISAASLPLPSGAATSANQSTMITSLQLIDDLRNALGSVDTDDLQVDVKTMPTATVQAAGGDKIFGFEGIVEEEVVNVNLDAGLNHLTGTAVGSGKVWEVTQASIIYFGTVPSAMYVTVEGLGNGVGLLDVETPATDQWFCWSGKIYLQVGDYVRASCEGATAGDDFYLRYCGVSMTAPS